MNFRIKGFIAHKVNNDFAVFVGAETKTTSTISDMERILRSNQELLFPKRRFKDQLVLNWEHLNVNLSMEYLFNFE